MDESRGPTGAGSPYMRVAWPVVAGGLLVVLLIALGAGLLANRATREQLAVVTATPAPAALAAPATPAATQTPVPVASATAGPRQATQTPPAVTATAVPTAVVKPTPRPTVGPALADEVSDAY